MVPITRDLSRYLEPKSDAVKRKDGEGWFWEWAILLKRGGGPRHRPSYLPSYSPEAAVQSYSMNRAVRRAISSPCRRATTWSAMSIPADTPAEVTICPSSTTRVSFKTSVPAAAAAAAR